MRIILLNGPPRSGKDFAGEKLCDMIAGAELFKFSQELKERCHGAFRLVCRGEPLPFNAYEEVKDHQLDDFDGLTPRQAYIAFSENFLKPTFSADVLGRWLIRRLVGCSVAIITDSGFVEEAQCLVDEFGAENVTLVRIHRVGHDFVGDSRSYIELEGVRTVDVENTGDKRFLQNLKDALL